MKHELAMVLTVMSATACSPGSDETHGGTAQALRGALDDEGRFAQVASVSSSCSGVLITPSHVLTAAHCVQNDGRGSVTFNLERDSGETRPVQVASCAMLNEYTVANRGCLREELLAGRDPRDVALSLGDRCGVLRHWSVCPEPEEEDSAFDVAVLQLERPIPPPGAAEDPRVAAGDLFLEPLPLAETSDGLLPGATAVGFGDGSRRFVEFSSVLLGPVTLVRTSALERGDSGGPLLVQNEAGETLVYGVASGFRGTTGIWTGVGGQPAVREWIRRVTDRNSDGRVDTACRQPAGRGAHADADSTRDRDGDGYLDEEDRCPDTYNPCQVATDFDGDGVDDDCDACPRDASIADPRGSGVDTDDDGTPDRCDCRPTLFDSAYADVDADFVPQACDNCRAVANIDQSNRDGDFLGDACDVCADAPDDSVGGAPRDTDEDGVPDACDNCVVDPNPLQENCNEDVELLYGLDPVGDACDPVPCGETRLPVEQADGEIDGRPARVWRMDTLLVDARSEEAQEARTGFRFCPCSVARSDDVATRRLCARATVANCVLDDRITYDAIVTDPSFEPRTWRFTSLFDFSVDASDIIDPDPGAPTPLRGLRREAVVSYRPFEGSAMFEADLSAVWDHVEDRERWGVVFDEPVELDQAFPGVVWTHTPGARATAFAEELRRLTSHYWSGPAAEPTREARAPFPCLRLIGPWIGASGCALCAHAFPTGYIGLPGREAFGGCEGPFEPPVIALPGPPIDIAELVTFDPAVFARDDLQWLAAAEPAEWLAPEGPVLAALGDGLAPALALAQGPEGLQVFGAPPPDHCGPNQCEHPPPVLSAGAHTRSSASESEGSGVVVLSNREQKIYVLEGDARTRIGRVRVQSLRADVREQRDAALGRVLAATYRAQDRSLYVLDEVQRRRRGRWRPAHIRLVRLPQAGGPPEVVARWPRLGWNTRYQLAPDTSGALWVLASRDHGPHVVVRLEPRRRPARERWRPTGWRLGPGALTDLSPHGSALGLSYVVQTREGAEPRGVRPTELWSLGPGALRRCF